MGSRHACLTYVGEGAGSAGGGAILLAVVLFLLLAFMKVLYDRRAPWYQRSLIRKPLRKVGVILLHDVEHRFHGEPAMVLGK